MSSGNVRTPLFVRIPEYGYPQLGITSIKAEVANHSKLPAIEPISIINQSYQKAVKIHEVLSYNKELSNNEKLDFCNLGRYFMKKYLKEIISKLDE